MAQFSRNLHFLAFWDHFWRFMGGFKRFTKVLSRTELVYEFLIFLQSFIMMEPCKLYIHLQKTWKTFQNGSIFMKIAFFAFLDRFLRFMDGFWRFTPVLAQTEMVYDSFWNFSQSPIMAECCKLFVNLQKPWKTLQNGSIFQKIAFFGILGSFLEVYG